MNIIKYLSKRFPGTKSAWAGFVCSWAACVLLLCIMPAAPAQSQEVVIPLNDVTKRVLDNGLTLLVKEDHSAPVATVNVWVKTGYFNETTEWAGISHLLEHMFFKGTPTRPVGKIQDEVKSCGGYWNAGTIYDHTNYYIVLPSSEINRALDIEADALLHSNFPQEEIDKEQEVVIQEILRKYDNPGAMVWEKMMDLLYANHYLGRWRMGQPEQVRRMDREVLVGYYTDRYRPENIILSIVGDVDTDAVLAEAARLLGPMPKGELKHHASPPEPEQTALRFRQDTMDVAQTYLAIGFQAPPVLHEDEHAAEVLSYVLGSGKSARLYREIKERSGLAHSISAGYYALPSAGAFYIEAELDADKIDETRRAIFREIERLKQQPPAAAELERIKARIEYSFLSSMEDVSGQSNNLAYYESLGDYNLLNDYVARLRAVTPEDVQRAAQKYLLIDKAAMQELRPEDKKDDATAAQVEASLREAVAETQFEAQAQTTSAARAAAPAPQSPAQDAPVSLHTLSNGAQVIIKDSNTVMNIDNVLSAIGQRADVSFAAKEAAGFQVETTKWATFAADEQTLQTNIPYVFTSGDVFTGPQTVVKALGTGRRAARSIHLLVTGQDVVAPPNELLKPSPESLMPHITGVPEAPRAHMPEMSIADRALTFKEVELGLKPGQADREANRCLQCGNVCFDQTAFDELFAEV